MHRYVHISQAREKTASGLPGTPAEQAGGHYLYVLQHVIDFLCLP
jgi:hypothetical protein